MQPFGDSVTHRIERGVPVMLSCHSWRQAQVCMALARASNDPALKQRYEELALGFAQNAGNDDPATTDASFASIKPNCGNQSHC
jgi:hypothetical protein